MLSHTAPAVRTRIRRERVPRSGPERLWLDGATSIPAVGHSASRSGLDVVLAGTASDAHTWNLVFLQLLLEEWGHLVRNLGPCVPEDVLADKCLRPHTDLIVISTVNGHGLADGLNAIRMLRNQPELASTPVVIGGKLGVGGCVGPEECDKLLRAGFDAVYPEGPDILAEFTSFTRCVAARVMR
jgi:methylaspartate mutase sigma subunit